MLVDQATFKEVGYVVLDGAVVAGQFLEQRAEELPGLAYRALSAPRFWEVRGVWHIQGGYVRVYVTAADPVFVPPDLRKAATT